MYKKIAPNQWHQPTFKEVVDKAANENGASRTFDENRDTNGTNNIEKQYMPLAKKWLLKHFIFALSTGNSKANRLGEDFSVWEPQDDELDGKKLEVDLKVCQYEESNRVLVDVRRKKDCYDKDYQVLNEDVKITQLYLFINSSFIFLVPAEVVNDKVWKIANSDELKIMKKDKHKTTLKGYINIEPEDCYRDYKGNLCYERRNPFLKKIF